MFYLYDLNTYSRNYGAIPAGVSEDGPISPSRPSGWDNEGFYNDNWKSRWNSTRLMEGRRNRGEEQGQLLNIDEAIQSLGMGRFQIRMLLITGLLLAADSIEIVLLSYLSKVPLQRNDGEDPDSAFSFVVFPAALVGALVWGVLGDTIGRRRTLVGMTATVAVFGIATSIATTLHGMLLTRSIVAFGLGGLTVPFCTLSELLPPSERGGYLTFVQVFWTVGGLFVHWVLREEALLQNDSNWRILVGVLSVPSLIALFLAVLMVPESPRWLLAKNRSDEALAILRAAAIVNGRDPTLLFPAGTILYSHEPEETVSSVFNLCRPGWVHIVSALWTTYFGMAFLDHGTVSLAVSVFANDDREQDYQAVFSATSEFLGLWLVLFMIDKLGRSRSQFLFYVSGGMLCLALSLLEDYEGTDMPPNLPLAITFLSHSFMFGGTCATWVSTTEILATESRTTGHATANMVARIGTAISSYLLGRIYSLPAEGLVLFVVSLWTACTAGSLPETQYKEMGVVQYPSRNTSASRAATSRRTRQCSEA